MTYNLKRSVLLCAIAMTAPGITLAANETLVVTAAPPQTADSPTQGYTATTSTGATKTDEPLITTGQSISAVAPRVLIPSPCAASTAATSITCSLTACA